MTPSSTNGLGYRRGILSLGNPDFFYNSKHDCLFLQREAVISPILDGKNVCPLILRARLSLPVTACLSGLPQYPQCFSSWLSLEPSDPKESETETAQCLL